MFSQVTKQVSRQIKKVISTLIKNLVYLFNLIQNSKGREVITYKNVKDIYYNEESVFICFYER